MAYKKSYKKRGSRRKSYRRKKTYRRRKPMMSRVETRVVKSLSQLMPDRLRCPLAWNDGYNLTVGVAGAPKQYAWRLNSPYDPDQSVGISQKSAYGFGNIMAFYSNYRCFASSIKIVAINQSSSAGEEVLLALYPAHQLITTSTDPNAKSAANKPYAKHVLLGLSQGMGKATIKHFCSVKKILGISSIEYENNFVGSISTDPADVFYWNMCFDSHGGNGSPTVSFDVQITYYCEFYSRVNLVPYPP